MATRNLIERNAARSSLRRHPNRSTPRVARGVGQGPLRAVARGGLAAPASPNDDALEVLARMAHELIRAWCEFNGDLSQKPWAQAPEWQRQSTLEGIRFYIDHPNADDGATHQAWLDEKRRAGWTWGPVKDPELKQHPCMVAFDRLPPQQQFKDRLFRTVVRAGLGG